ncbi:two-component regulator propeller domain-containing protein [Spirosoma sp. KNUC1025]|uniref:two-component regulator propeller domain-containing protein n=1 Tax=Spirosoma sp. KNUC1025 TaxID=2894082 RepID=UPI00386B4138
MFFRKPSHQPIHLLLWCFGLILAIASPVSGWAQNQEVDLQFDHLSAKNGLSHNSILCIWQDRDGFLWLGTERWTESV